MNQVAFAATSSASASQQGPCSSSAGGRCCWGYTHTYANIHTYIHINTLYLHTLIHTLIHTYVIHTNMYVHSYMHTNQHACALIYTYIHTLLPMQASCTIQGQGEMLVSGGAHDLSFSIAAHITIAGHMTGTATLP